MHYAMELLRITGALHAAHVIHTDIKPDNLLLADAATTALPAWQAGCPGLWSQTGLCLIDYGRAIDTALLPSNTHFQVCLPSCWWKLPCCSARLSSAHK